MMALLCSIAASIPLASFLAAAVVCILHGHPYFGCAFMAMAFLTSPGIHLKTPGTDKKDVL